jgi:3-phenylpropionate/cinnamic acid dioxygenase small subunit
MSATASPNKHDDALHKLDPECMPGSMLYGEIVQFLYLEAQLLDEGHFRQWLALFTEDVRYTMPVRTTQMRTKGSGFQDVAFIEDNFNSLTTRVERLLTDSAWSETPPSRTRHFLTNILVCPGDGPAEFCVRACFMVTRSRGEHGYQMFTGVREDRLRRLSPGRFQIAHRRILGDQTVITSTNLSILF